MCPVLERGKPSSSRPRNGPTQAPLLEPESGRGSVDLDRVESDRTRQKVIHVRFCQDLLLRLDKIIIYLDFVL